MHSMSFHYGVQETILFERWRTTDWQGIFGSSIGIILLGAIYEALKCYRDYLCVSTSFQCNSRNVSKKNDLFSIIHVLQTVLHALQIILGYFLMFIFMTYNVYLCIAVVTGMTIGYFLFSWQRSHNENECCA
ncbi:high affinity copper uptake protein 1-like isoform X4 [Belonocnema kinseyi]|uniref:high affinity copper uptake protein 1-like isoform X4 n=1 Tax=Belonocnema kinseyi TaxID=2817044 RepID=UPI00143CE7F2|nr:high affinity copper uptake protein 1-like isoform X4 [Belonocnema kinseyi]